MTSPLVFDVLQELGVPRCVQLVAVHPVEHEFRQLLTGKLPVHPGHIQKIPNAGIWLPVATQTLRFPGVAQATLIACPALADERHKTAIDVFGWAAALAPVKNELRANTGRERCIYTALMQDIHGVGAGLPIVVKARRLRNLKHRVTRLGLPPGPEHMLPITGLPRRGVTLAEVL